MPINLWLVILKEKEHLVSTYGGRIILTLIVRKRGISYRLDRISFLAVVSTVMNSDSHLLRCNTVFIRKYSTRKVVHLFSG